MNTNIKFFSRPLNKDLIVINKLLMKTYLLLSCTILFSAFVSFLSIRFDAKPVGVFSTFILYFLILFLINLFKNSFLRLFFVFLLTGFLGYCCGPLISVYLSLKNGAELVFLSLSVTGGLFFLLSFYVLVSRKDFSFLNNFLFIGAVVIFFMFFMSAFLNIKLIHLVFSGLIIVFSSACILYELSSIVNDGERDYVMVTVSLYLSVYNIFLGFIRLFGILSGDE